MQIRKKFMHIFDYSFLENGMLPASLVSVTSAVNAQALKALTRAHEGVHTGRCTGCPPYA